MDYTVQGMRTSHRLILFLAACPSSAVMAAAALFMLDVSWGYRFLIAAGIFAGSEWLLAMAMSGIPARMGPETLPGRHVNVLSDFSRGQCGSCFGYVQLAGERWQARTAGPMLQAPPRTGHELRIERVEGLTLLVSPQTAPRTACSPE